MTDKGEGESPPFCHEAKIMTNLLNLKRGTATVNDILPKDFAAGATLTVVPDLHRGGTIYLDTAAGSTVTLPAATGSGDEYTFMVKVLATSNNHIVKVANAADTMSGVAITTDTDTAGTVTAWATAAASDTITLNRSTTGSARIGEVIFVKDVAAAKWAVQALLSNTGDGATPFSATVS
jgi:hypothetical protein